MSDPTFTLRSFIICDEIREEVGGKQIIIGAYAGAILLPMIPFIARIFTVRFELFAHRHQYNQVTCAISKPDGNLFSRNSIPYTVRYRQFPVAIHFANLYPNFEQVGEYNAFLSMDSEQILAGSFRILTSAELPAAT